jgi:hypothetical protein
MASLRFNSRGPVVFSQPVGVRAGSTSAQPLSTVGSLEQRSGDLACPRYEQEDIVVPAVFTLPTCADGMFLVRSFWFAWLGPCV